VAVCYVGMCTSNQLVGELKSHATNSEAGLIFDSKCFDTDDKKVNKCAKKNSRIQLRFKLGPRV